MPTPCIQLPRFNWIEALLTIFCQEKCPLPHSRIHGPRSSVCCDRILSAGLDFSNVSVCEKLKCSKARP
ncbi:MAG: hypothetical protein COT73_04140 [Bdellovibrio sp. CG10_big_fil_rev_8_21_14_0_10_47_8]|nr:MAG: hypothetical protein COT73_04140 [Bdellovibrio sp. CG10_big_fil_rev_8_21_14_0_10_47_8]